MIALVLAAVAADPSALDDRAFRFCHAPVDERFDRVFCGLLDELPPERCPGLRERCAQPDEVRSRGCGEEPAADPPAAGSSSEPAPADEPRFAAPAACVGTTGPAAVLAWVVAILVALGVAGIAIVILRAIGWRPDPPPPAVARIDDDDEQPAFADVVDDVPDLPSADLLAAARQALAAGRLGESAVLARGAVLRELGERRVLRLHRARTDREYLAAADADVRADLGDVLHAAELHRWGRVPLDAQGAERALRAAGRLLGLVALLALAPAAFGFDRYGPAGDMGLRRALERHGHRASFRAAPLAELAPGDPIDVLVLDLTGLSPDDAAWSAIRAWVEAGGVLWVGGGPSGFPELGERLPTSGDASIAEHLADEGLAEPRWPDGVSWVFDGEVEAWVEGVAGAVVAGAPVGEGYVLAVADPILFWNGALVHPANEAFLGEAPYRVQARGYARHAPIRIELATVGARGGSDPSPTASLANLRLLPLFVQVLVFWVALVLWRGWPFTRLLDPPERDRARFADHLRAVARHYRDRRATGHVLRAYAAWVLERYRREGLWLAARRAGYAPGAAEALVARAEAVAAAPSPSDDRHDLETMEELWKITRPR